LALVLGVEVELAVVEDADWDEVEEADVEEAAAELDEEELPILLLVESIVPQVELMSVAHAVMPVRSLG